MCYGLFSMSGGEFKLKTTIETLKFPCDFISRIKMKASLGNIDINFIDGHLIKINKTNLILTEPCKIIATNNINTFIAYLYDDNQIYLPNNDIKISFNKLISILNAMNKIG